MRNKLFMLLTSLILLTALPSIAAAFAIAISANAGGIVSPPEGKIQVAPGAALDITFTALDGHHVEDVIVDSVSRGAVNSWSFVNVREMHTIKVKFRINSYTVSTDTGLGGGRILPATLKAKHGQTKRFIVKPAAGMRIASLTVNAVPVAGLPASGSYKLHLPVTSDTTIAATFSELHPLGVNFVSPPADAGNIATDSQIFATFSRDMDAATIDISSLILTSPSGTVAGTVSYAGRTATFSPSSPLAANTTYRATVTTSAKDSAGKSMPENYSWDFSTVAIPGTAWLPPSVTSWQLQLSTTPLPPYEPVGMYDVDLFETPQEVIDALHGQGSKVACYFSAGSYENWRSDAPSFPKAVLGNNMKGWPGERWLDIRRIDLLAPIMTARLDLCKSKGFDSVDPDNVEGYLNRPGFPLNASEQLTYNRWLASEAHNRGLSIGLKNDLSQIPDLVSSFDWALNEQCFAYNECTLLEPFTLAAKAVFNVEYTKDSTFCSQANQLGFNSLLKKLSLDAWREPCR